MISRESERGSGRTTNQLKLAKASALFIWCNDIVEYPKALARHIDRTDIRIAPFSDLSDGRYQRYLGTLYSQVVLDHACHESTPPCKDWWKYYLELCARVYR